MSRICLLAQAKNEDHYLQEWIDYHLKLKFDDIVIIQDDWKANIKEDSRVHLVNGDIKENIPHDRKQMRYYSNFIKKHNRDYDWIAIFDIDEYLYIRNCDDIHKFLDPKIDCASICCHWRFFGDSGITEINGDYRIVDRFIRSNKKCDNTFKSIYNMNQLRSLIGQKNLDTVDLLIVHEFKNITVNNIRLLDHQYGMDGKSKVVFDYKNRNIEELENSVNIGYLAHYRKSYPEFVERYTRSHSEWWTNFKKSLNYDMKKAFDTLCPPTINEVENKDLVNFIHDKNKCQVSTIR